MKARNVKESFSCRDAAPIFDSLEDVFNQVPLAIEIRIVPSVAGSIGARWDAGQTAVVFNELAKFVGVETFVADEDHRLG